MDTESFLVTRAACRSQLQENRAALTPAREAYWGLNMSQFVWPILGWGIMKFRKSAPASLWSSLLRWGAGYFFARQLSTAPNGFHKRSAVRQLLNYFQPKF